MTSFPISRGLLPSPSLAGAGPLDVGAGPRGGLIGTRVPEPPIDVDAIGAFPAGEHARAVRVQEERHLDGALAALGLDRGRPALVLVGGAGDLPDDQGLDSLFADIVALSERLRSSIVDGGTDAGIMRLVGKARAAAQGTFPLVGVAAEGTVVIPGGLPAGKTPTRRAESLAFRARSRLRLG